MKKTIIVTTISCLVLGDYALGQNATKNKPVEPRCCKHTQQIAEDLHWIREQMSKPYKPPVYPDFNDPGNLKDPGKIKVQKLDFKLEPPNIAHPKIPKR